MTDLSQTIAPKSDQLNADDLIAGPRTIKVTRVSGSENADQPVSIYFEADNNKPYKPCKSMRRVLVQVWGSDGNTYAGRSMTLYCDPEVKFGGIKVGGIRISHMSGIAKQQTLMLTTTRARRAEYIVKPLGNDPAENAILLASDAAEKGTEAFREFWNSDVAKINRDHLKARLSEFQAKAEEADNRPLSTAERMQAAKDEQREDPKPHWTDEIDTSDAFPGDEAFTDGATAHGKGVKRSDCPFSDPTIACHWLGGWDGAQKASAPGEGN